MLLGNKVRAGSSSTLGFAVLCPCHPHGCAEMGSACTLGRALLLLGSSRADPGGLWGQRGQCSREPAGGSTRLRLQGQGAPRMGFLTGYC